MTRIKARRLLKNRIIELYKIEVLAALSDRLESRSRKYYGAELTENQQRVVDLLRSKIGYSCKTNNCDIFNSFIRFAEEKIKH